MLCLLRAYSGTGHAYARPWGNAMIKPQSPRLLEAPSLMKVTGKKEREREILTRQERVGTEV